VANESRGWRQPGQKVTGPSSKAKPAPVVDDETGFEIDPEMVDFSEPVEAEGTGEPLEGVEAPADGSLTELVDVDGAEGAELVQEAQEPVLEPDGAGEQAEEGQDSPEDAESADEGQDTADAADPPFEGEPGSTIQGDEQEDSE